MPWATKVVTNPVYDHCEKMPERSYSTLRKYWFMANYGQIRGKMWIRKYFYVFEERYKMMLTNLDAFYGGF